MKVDKFWVNLEGINNTAWNIIIEGLDREHIDLLTVVKDEIPFSLPAYLTINTTNKEGKCYFESISNILDLFDGDDFFEYVTYDEFKEWLLFGTLPDTTIISLPNDNPPTIFSNPIIPDHYKSGDNMDVIDVCKVLNLNFNRGNVLKYIARAGKKDDELQDLNKALEYLKREIKYIENKK